MKHDSEALTVRLYELLLLVLAALCIGIGIYSHAVTPAVPDAMGFRIGLAVVSLLAAGALYVAPFLWRHAGLISYGVLALHTGFHLYVLYASHLALAQSIGLLLVALLTAVSLHNLRWVLGYGAFVVGAGVAIGVLLPTTSLNPALLAIGLAAVPAIGFLAVQARRILEEELYDTIAESKVAVKAKSEFLATMSHEIRTPMNGVIGMVTLLGDTELTDQQRDYVDTIRLSGDTLLTIINDILDFSKIEADRIELEEAPFELRDMIEEALDLLGTKAHEKGLDLVYQIDDDVPPALMGDVTRVRQVLVNLVGNAIKFTQAGDVLVTVKKRRTVNGEHELCFAVRDTGIGIPADRLDRLFQSFSQVDSSHTRKYGGTGLGLAISKRLAELMGGTMWVESEVGVGSTFSFTILARMAATRSRASLNGRQAALAEKRVLVVDENPTVRRVLAEQLRAWGLTVVAAPSGREALRLAHEGGQFDVAVLDLHLSDLDTLKLARGLREHCAQLPIVGLILSGSRVRTEGLLVATISKPVKQGPLFEALMAAAQQTGAEQSLCNQTITSEGIWIQRDQTAPLPGTLSPSSADAGHLPLPALRILLAEDNAVNQKVALRILERLGYDADLAANGQEVLDAFQLKQYDVVLMDVQMPELDGLQATQRLRAELPADRQPRIVAMTANAMEGDRERCLAAGMDDYVSKPVRREELMQALMRCQPLSAVKLTAAPLGTSGSQVPILSGADLQLLPPDLASEPSPETDAASAPATPAARPETNPPPATNAQRHPERDEAPPPPQGGPPAAPAPPKRNPFKRPVPPQPLDIEALFPAPAPPPAPDFPDPASHGPTSPPPLPKPPQDLPPASPPSLTSDDLVADPSFAFPTFDPLDLDQSEEPPPSEEPGFEEPGFEEASVEPLSFDALSFDPLPARTDDSDTTEPPAPEPPVFEPPEFEPPEFELPEFELPEFEPTVFEPMDFDAPVPEESDEAEGDAAYSEPPPFSIEVDAPVPSWEDTSWQDELPVRPNADEATVPEPAAPNSETVETVVAEEAASPDQHALPTADVVLEHLQEISGLDDPGFAREVLESYLRADLELIGTIVEGVRMRSYREVTAAVHKLKSSSRTLGAEDLADLCEALEAESRREQFGVDAVARSAVLREQAFALRSVIQEAIRRLG